MGYTMLCCLGWPWFTDEVRHALLSRVTMVHWWGTPCFAIWGHHGSPSAIHLVCCQWWTMVCCQEYIMVHCQGFTVRGHHGSLLCTLWFVARSTSWFTVRDSLSGATMAHCCAHYGLLPGVHHGSLSGVDHHSSLSGVHHQGTLWDHLRCGAK